MILAWLLLLTGLTISAVAIYYSVVGLAAIFSAAIIPIVIMGSALEVGKLVCASWLKDNWERAPRFMKYYMIVAVIVLMLITSMGIFGFLSKAHSDQSLVSGDVTSRIAIYDEKIRTAKDNIDANRKALKQMDEAVDQVMGRSSDEKGAEKAVAIRRAQQKERVRLQSEITAEQKTVAAISEERAPIAAEVRKVEAEVGPIKYIAHLLYGENPDANILEKAVIWVTVLIVIVLDPLAVVLLLASQYSFQRFQELEEEPAPVYVADVGEKPTADEKPVEEDNFFLPTYEEITPPTSTTASTANIVDDTLAAIIPNTTSTTVAYQFLDEVHEEEIPHVVDTTPNFEGVKDTTTGEWIQTGPAFTETKPVDPYDDKGVDWDNIPPGQEYITIDGSRMHIKAAREMYGPKHIRVTDTYVQNEEQKESGLWNKVISEQEYRDKLEKNKNEPTPNTNNPT